MASKVTFYPTFDAASTLAAQKDTYKLGRDLLGRVKSNWSSAARRVDVNSRLGPGTYRIEIGASGRSKLYTHLIEFGGGRHSVKAPTRRAIDAAGLRVKWK